MKVVSFRLKGAEGHSRSLRRAFLSALCAGMVFLSSVVPARAGDWREVLFESLGAAAGAAMSSRHDSDLQRGGAAAAGVAVGAILYSALTGEQVQVKDAAGHAIAAGLGAMATGRKNSDLERAGAAVGGILVYEGTKWMVENARQDPGTGYRTVHRPPTVSGSWSPPVRPPEEASTTCHLRRVYVRENGKVVSERVEEVCEAQKTMRGYYPEVSMGPGQ